MMRISTMSCVVCVALLFGGLASVRAAEKPGNEKLTLVVMDPLAAPLACDCVKGYAQRKYEKLGEFLQQKLRRGVTVVWNESLAAGMENSAGRADIVIGKHSVVLADATALSLRLRPLARLTGADDSVTQTGLIVVRRDDPAKSVADLRDYRIFFGPADCDEKHAAPIALLKRARIAIPSPLEVSPACSNAAETLLELPPDAKAATVISSYAQPLLEGCGTIMKGDLRVIGESLPVPFITAFVNEQLSAEEQAAIASALDDVGLQAELLIALETGSGFQPFAAEAAEAADAAKKND